MALPGVMPAAAHAQSAPDEGVVALKYLDYRDWQPGGSRMSVHAPALYVLKPLPDAMTLEGSLVHDSMAGASPLYHNTLSGASGTGITEYRTAGDVKLTKYFDRFALGVGGAASSERDYLSRAASLDARVFSADRNTTLAFGVGGAWDRIDSVNGVALDQRRYTLDFLVGITQALSPEAIVQSNLTWSRGHGYYSDPYKVLDARPDSRRIFAWLTRYNQYLPATDSTVRVSYRFLHDSFGVDQHTLELAWVQPLPQRFTLTPGIRYATQDAADFYHDPPFPTDFRPGEPYTADTRLSAFGAFTVGAKIAYDFGQGWTGDLRFDMYRQRASWRLGGNGSPGLEPFSARWIEAGVAKTF